ncbi:MAG: M56 family metallopeptidase [Verrucomicrobiales bacterium]
MTFALSAAAALLVVLAMRSILQGRVAPDWISALWLVALARMLVPAAPESPLSAMHLAQGAAGWVAGQGAAGPAADAGRPTPAAIPVAQPKDESNLLPRTAGALAEWRWLRLQNRRRLRPIRCQRRARHQHSRRPPGAAGKGDSVAGGGKRCPGRRSPLRTTKPPVRPAGRCGVGWLRAG